MWLQLSGRLIGPGWIRGVLTQYLAVAGAVSGGSSKFLFPVASLLGIAWAFYIVAAVFQGDRSGSYKVS